MFQLRGRDDAGRSVLVKVYGADAYENQVLGRLWRTVWYRDVGPAASVGRAQRAEHEAFLTLLAGRADVPTWEVVAAGTTSDQDALLVVADDGTAIGISDLSPEHPDPIVAGCWHALARLHAAGIAHLRVGPTTVLVRAGQAQLVDLSQGVLAPRRDQLMTDRSQMLALTAAAVGSERAVDAAAAALGSDGLSALLPYLQPAAFGGDLRQTLKTAKVDVDELRAASAKQVAAEEPELAQLRRVTLGSMIQVGLLVLAASALITGVSGLDLAQVGDELKGAEWSWFLLGFVLVQLPRLFQAVATLGTVPKRLPFLPVYVMQLATGFMNLALPSSLARMSINVRFFQRQGVPPATAITSGVIDSFAGNAIQVVLLALLLVFSASDLDVTLDVQTDGGAGRLLVLLIVVFLATITSALVIGRFRRAIGDRIRQWWPDVRAATQTLRASNKLAAVFGANVAAEVLFAAGLGMFARGLGYDIALVDLLVINLSVSLFASFIPVPGGIGVVEGGLTVGLVAAGLSDEAAFSTAVCYRLSCFYLPTIWGWFAMRWLKEHGYL